MKLKIFIAPDGHSPPVCGIVTMEDRITPLKQAKTFLKRISDQVVVPKGFTNHIGNYSMSGLIANESCLLEIDSPNYTGTKEIVVEPGKKNWHEFVAYKRKSEQDMAGN